MHFLILFFESLTNTPLCVHADRLTEPKNILSILDVHLNFIVNWKYLRTENQSNHPLRELKLSPLVQLTDTL